MAALGEDIGGGTCGNCSTIEIQEIVCSLITIDTTGVAHKFGTPRQPVCALLAPRLQCTLNRHSLSVAERIPRRGRLSRDRIPKSTRTAYSTPHLEDKNTTSEKSAHRQMVGFFA